MPDTSNEPSPFRARYFHAFLCARGAATIAYQMMGVAVGWQVYDLTRKAFDLGMIGLVQFIPLVALILVAGHAADRYSRKLIIMLAQLLEGVALAILAVGTFHGWVAKEFLFVIVFVIGIGKAFEYPTMQTMLPSLVEPQYLPKTMAVAATVSQGAVILGPVLGGFIYIAGPAAVYATGCVLFLCSAVIMTRLPTRQNTRPREPVTLQSLFAGITFIRSRPVILGAISLDLFAVLLGGATALLPVYAKDILHAGPWALGLLRAAPAVGAFAASIYLARNPLNRRVGKVMFSAVAWFGVGTIIFALSAWIPLSFAALVVLGCADMISVVIRAALVQLETPDEMRGRVSAINSVFIGTSNQFGEFESGITAAWLGVVPAAVLGGIGTLVIATIWMRLFPDLLRRDSLQAHHLP